MGGTLCRGSGRGVPAAPADIRKALDRRLWADTEQRLIETEPIADLAAAMRMSDQAADRLPEKPDLPARLVEKAVAAARRQLATLLLADVKELAEVYRVRLRRPDDAQKVLRDWLEAKRSQAQRHRRRGAG